MEKHNKEMPGPVKALLAVCVVAGVILLFEYGIQAGRWLYAYVHP